MPTVRVNSDQVLVIIEPESLKICAMLKMKLLNNEGMAMNDRAHELLHYWFGDLGHADLPSSDRTTLWFGDNEQVVSDIKGKFGQEYLQAVAGHLDRWADTP